MRLLFVLHYPPPVHGAAVVGGYIKKSRKVNGTFDSRFINLGTSASVEDIGRNSLRKLFRYLLLIWQVLKQLVSFRPQLCYFTPTAAGTGFYKDAIIITIVKLFRVRTVLHYHNKGVSNRSGKFVDNLLYRFVFRNSRVILLSKYLYPDIQKYVPESRVVYCPNGKPDSPEQRAESAELCIRQDIGRRSRAEEGERGGTTEILFLSHLIRSKGVLVLIEACALLKERGLNFHCTMAGGDAELTRKEVEVIIRQKGLEGTMTVAGQRQGEEKAELMKSTDIFVHPSFNDCMPLVLLEAMQYSLPIMSTFEGAIPDIVEDGITGFLVPQKNVIALADKLEVLIKDPELRQQMGIAGRAKFEREFTLDKFEKRLVEILREVVDS